MRYCLTCRRFSTNSPLCTQCGRSFGGRLCTSDRRHLNPPDAQVCGQCGATELVEAAASVALGPLLRLLVIGSLICLVWWHEGHILGWASQGFLAATGYRSPAVWLIEKCGSFLVILFLIYFLSNFLPGESGGQLRSLVSRGCTQLLSFVFQIVRGFMEMVGRALIRLMQGERTRR